MHSIGSARAAIAGAVAALCVAPSAHADVTISTAATSNMSCVSGVCSPTAANAVLNVGDLTSMLAGGSVTVNTGTGSLAAQVKDIIVAATFNWASANALTLDAYRSVTFTAPVAVNGAAPVSFVTDDGGSDGNLSFISGGRLSFLGTANGLTINGKAYRLESSIATLVAAIAHKPSGYYALSASYDAGSDGTYKGSPISNKFKGNFDGLGNAIANLTINGDKNIGLFAYLMERAQINSLVISNATINVKGGSSAGPAVGINYGTVFNSSASGLVSGTLNAKLESSLGGLVGNNHGMILDSYASTTVQATSKSRPFGFGYLGGLAGLNGGTLEGSDAIGAVSVTGLHTEVDLGGLAGFSPGTIENCYAEGNVTTSNYAFVGGLVGQTDSSIVDSYSTGSPTGQSGSQVGGFVGSDNSNGELSSDYWDTTTSGITNLSQGAGNIANDPGITGETTAQLQSGLPSGFDPTIWAENPSINNGLPYLIANPPQ